MLRRPWILGLVAGVAFGCARIPPDPLQIERGVLTVDNRTDEDWRHVEIWVNRYFRVAVPAIRAGGRFRVPLDAFVSGYAQRFDPRRTTIDDLYLTAIRPDGASMLVRKDPQSGLAALGGSR